MTEERLTESDILLSTLWSLRVKCLNSRQRISLKESKKRSARSRNETEFVPELHLVYRCVGVPTTNYC